MSSREEKCAGKEGMPPNKENVAEAGNDHLKKGEPKGVVPPPGAPSVDLTNLPSSDEESEVKIVGVKPPTPDNVASQGPTLQTGNGDQTPYKQPDNVASQGPRYVTNCKATPVISHTGFSRTGLLARGRDSAIRQGRGLKGNPAKRSHAFVSTPSVFQTVVKKLGVSHQKLLPPTSAPRSSAIKAESSVGSQRLDVLDNGAIWQTGHENSFLKPPAKKEGWGAWAYDFHARAKTTTQYEDDRLLNDPLQHVGGAQMNLGSDHRLEPYVPKEVEMKGHRGMSKKMQDKVNATNRRIRAEHDEKLKAGRLYIERFKAEQDFQSALKDVTNIEPLAKEEEKKQFPKNLTYHETTDGLPSGVFLLRGLAVYNVDTNFSGGIRDDMENDEGAATPAITGAPVSAHAGLPARQNAQDGGPGKGDADGEKRDIADVTGNTSIARKPKGRNEAKIPSDGDGVCFWRERNQHYYVRHTSTDKFWFACDKDGNMKNPNPYKKPDFRIRWRANDKIEISRCENFGCSPPKYGLLEADPRSRSKAKAKARPGFYLPEDNIVGNVESFDAELIAATEKAEEQYKKRSCSHKDLQSSQRELFSAPGGDAVPPTPSDQEEPSVETKELRIGKGGKGEFSEAVTSKDKSESSHSNKSEAEEGTIEAAPAPGQAKKEQGRDNKTLAALAACCTPKVSQGNVSEPVTTKKKCANLQSKKTADAEASPANEDDGAGEGAKESDAIGKSSSPHEETIEIGTRKAVDGGKGTGTNLGAPKSPGEDSMEIGSPKTCEGIAGKATATSLGASNGVGEEATANDGEHKDNETAAQTEVRTPKATEVGTPKAHGANKASISEASVETSPPDMMFGPFKPGALQTPVSSTSSESPPPINPKKGVSLVEFHGGGVALSFPDDNTTDGEEEQHHDDDDDEDDDDDDDDDNIDPNAVRVRKHHKSLVGAAVQ